MNAMADAVENSEFVIMCMSDSYKQSTYCQAEAEYAFNCKRRLVPLIMRPGYRPDGWLGFMIGSRIYVDFGRFDFDTACDKLITEISLQRKQPLPTKPVPTTQNETTSTIVSNQQDSLVPHRKTPAIIHSSHVLTAFMKRKAMSSFTRKPVIQWTDAEVLDFLYTQRLSQFMPLCDTMDGRALIRLYKMCISQSTKVYTLLNDELKSTHKIKLPISVYTRFLDAIEQRLSINPPTPMQTIPKPIPPKAPTRIQQYAPQPSKTQQYIQQPPKVQQYVQQPPKIPVVNNIPYQYPSYPNGPYDLIITSDAPALEILRAIERYGPNFQQFSSIGTQYSGRF